LKLKENFSKSSSMLSLNSSNLSSEVINQVVPKPEIGSMFNLKSSIYLLYTSVWSNVTLEAFLPFEFNKVLKAWLFI